MGTRKASAPLSNGQLRAGSGAASAISGAAAAPLTASNITSMATIRDRGEGMWRKLETERYLNIFPPAMS